METFHYWPRDIIIKNVLTVLFFGKDCKETNYSGGDRMQKKRQTADAASISSQIVEPTSSILVNYCEERWNFWVTY